MFDIHKVKPVHGWREFIGEVGIIVLGVLIALAFEQAVETLHWRAKVSETKDSLGDAIALHALAALEQQIVAPCVRSQLNNLEHSLFTPGAYKPAPRYSDSPTSSYVVRMPTRIWTDSVWSSVVSEGVSTHYDPEFRELIDLFYSQLAQMREVARRADDRNAGLNTLSLPIKPDQLAVIQLARTIEELRADENYLTLTSRQIIQYAGEAKMLPPAVEFRKALLKQSGTIAFCRAHHLPMNRLQPVDL